MKATRRIQFCSGHRVLNHESKCANAHGHNYVLYIYAECDQLDTIGRVIDFSVLKEKMGKWIDDNWDHTFLIYEKDKELLFVKNYLQSNKQVFICNFNPTAENMANFLLHDVCPKLFDGDGIKISKVVLYETENCFVEVSCEV